MSEFYNDIEIDNPPEVNSTLQEIYDNGFIGTPYDVHLESVLYRQNMQFAHMFLEAMGCGIGRLSIPYKIVQTLYPQWDQESQLQNNGTAWAYRNAGMLDYCIDAFFGETDFQGPFIVDNIHDPNNTGVLSFQQPAFALGHHGSAGFICKERPVTLHKTGIFKCNTIDEIRDAVAIGFGVCVYLNCGFNNVRDRYGMSEKSGKAWSHAVCIIGYDDTSETKQRLGGGSALVMNSWNKWNGGPKTNEQPEGSFWIRPEVLQECIGKKKFGYVVTSVRGNNKELVYDQIYVLESVK